MKGHESEVDLEPKKRLRKPRHRPPTKRFYWWVKVMQRGEEVGRFVARLSEAEMRAAREAAREELKLTICVPKRLEVEQAERVKHLPLGAYLEGEELRLLKEVVGG